MVVMVDTVDMGDMEVDMAAMEAGVPVIQINNYIFLGKNLMTIGY